MYLFELFGLELDIDPLFEELQRWWELALKNLPNILLAIIVAILGYIVTRFAKKYFDRLSRKMVSDGTVASLLSSVLTVFVVLAFLFLTLSVLNLTTVVQNILAGAGVVGLAIGLAFQDPILNLISGIILSLRSLFKIGDLIQVDGYLGKVREVTLRNTIIETLQGQEVLIPNKDVVQQAITNFDKLGKRRVDLSCGVSYGDDLAKVKKITIKAIKDNVSFDKSKEVQLFFNEFGNSSINYTLRFWLNPDRIGQADYLAAQSDAIMAIKNAYDANDIMIPFPIRTLDFGIKGGEKLAAMLNQGQDKNGKEKYDSPETGTEHQN